MQDIAFYIFALLTLVFGALVVFNPFTRNPVTGAMFLVLSMLGLAGLFTLLNAFFLGIIQVLVYAGAVLVVFLFVIMLLDLKVEALRKINFVGLGMGGLAVAAMGGLMLKVVWQSKPGAHLDPPALMGETYGLGTILFKQYLLPFEILSLLLLVAMIGVILLSKKDLK